MMKTTTIGILYQTEKLKALWQYQTEQQLQEELKAVFQAFYEENVPVEIREQLGILENSI